METIRYINNVGMNDFAQFGPLMFSLSENDNGSSRESLLLLLPSICRAGYTLPRYYARIDIRTYISQ